jgi:futalosine hydrolase
MHRGTIGLISAAPFECRLLINKIEGARKTSSLITTGRLGRNPVVHIESGVGLTNAAHATTVLIEKHAPEKIILFGIGGAYPGSGLNIGDIALAESEVYADLGVLDKSGLHPIDIIGIPLLRKGKKKYFDRFPMDNSLLKHSVKVLETRPGVFLTVSQVTGTRKRAIALRNRYGAVCENMEGAAVAHICARYGLPMLEVRGISNMVDNRDTRNWRKKAAAEKCQEVVLQLITYLSLFHR